MKDPRFTLFDKKNRGLSSARNVGIEYYNGSYVLVSDTAYPYHANHDDKNNDDKKNNDKNNDKNNAPSHYYSLNHTPHIPKSENEKAQNEKVEATLDSDDTDSHNNTESQNTESHSKADSQNNTESQNTESHSKQNIHTINSYNTDSTTDSKNFESHNNIESQKILKSSHIEHSEISTMHNQDSHSKADSHNNPKSTNTEPTLIPFSIQGDNPYTIYHVYKSSLYFTNQTKQTDTTNPTTLCKTESKKTIQDTHQDCAMQDFEVYEANANTKHETLQSPNTYNTQMKHCKAQIHIIHNYTAKQILIIIQNHHTQNHKRF